MLLTLLPIETRTPDSVGPVPSPGSPPIENRPVRHSASDDGGKSKIENCLDFISSDATLDRYSEIITPAGWKLDSYLRNPVFQNAHQYGDIIYTLGRALITEVRLAAPELSGGGSGNSHLFQRIQFAVDANPMAKIAHALYAGGFLRAVSVGFRPIRWEEPDAAQTNSAAGTCRKPRRRYLEQELLEVSAVAIPANPNALALAYKSGAIEKSDLKDTADLLRQITSLPDSATPSPIENRPVRHSASDDGGNSKIENALSLARQIHQLLKHM